MNLLLRLDEKKNGNWVYGPWRSVEIVFVHLFERILDVSNHLTQPWGIAELRISDEEYEKILELTKRLSDQIFLTPDARRQKTEIWGHHLQQGSITGFYCLLLFGETARRNCAVVESWSPIVESIRLLQNEKLNFFDVLHKSNNLHQNVKDSLLIAASNLNFFHKLDLKQKLSQQNYENAYLTTVKCQYLFTIQQLKNRDLNYDLIGYRTISSQRAAVKRFSNEIRRYYRGEIDQLTIEGHCRNLLRSWFDNPDQVSTFVAAIVNPLATSEEVSEQNARALEIEGAHTGSNGNDSEEYFFIKTPKFEFHENGIKLTLQGEAVLPNALVERVCFSSLKNSRVERLNAINYSAENLKHGITLNFPQINNEIILPSEIIIKATQNDTTGSSEISQHVQLYNPSEVYQVFSRSKDHFIRNESNKFPSTCKEFLLLTDSTATIVPESGRIRYTVIDPVSEYYYVCRELDESLAGKSIRIDNAIVEEFDERAQAQNTPAIKTGEIREEITRQGTILRKIHFTSPRALKLLDVYLKIPSEAQSLKLRRETQHSDSFLIPEKADIVPNRTYFAQVIYQTDCGFRRSRKVRLKNRISAAYLINEDGAERIDQRNGDNATFTNERLLLTGLPNEEFDSEDIWLFEDDFPIRKIRIGKELPIGELGLSGGELSVRSGTWNSFHKDKLAFKLPTLLHSSPKIIHFQEGNETHFDVDISANDFVLVEISSSGEMDQHFIEGPHPINNLIRIKSKFTNAVACGIGLKTIDGSWHLAFKWVSPEFCGFEVSRIRTQEELNWVRWLDLPIYDSFGRLSADSVCQLMLITFFNDFKHSGKTFAFKQTKSWFRCIGSAVRQDIRINGNQTATRLCKVVHRITKERNPSIDTPILIKNLLRDLPELAPEWTKTIFEYLRTIRNIDLSALINYLNKEILISLPIFDEQFAVESLDSAPTLERQKQLLLDRANVFMRRLGQGDFFEKGVWEPYLKTLNEVPLEQRDFLHVNCAFSNLKLAGILRAVAILSCLPPETPASQLPRSRHPDDSHNRPRNSESPTNRLIIRRSGQ